MRSRTIVFAIGVLLLAAFASSCGIFRGAGPPPAPPRPFNHAAHIDRGLDCATCHTGAETGIDAGMPEIDLCMSCHEDLDRDPQKPREQKVAWFLAADGKPAWSRLTAQSNEVIFSHKAHAAGKVGCTACHAGMEKDQGLSGVLVQRMDSCVACHARQAPAKNECATCHTVVDREYCPANHRQMWKQTHGGCSRAGRGKATVNDCAMCHQQDSCVVCHETEAPEDHRGAWRFRQHGFAADMDRTRCSVCHQADYCIRCHQENSPRSHAAGWNSPKNNHCMGCHEPLKSSGSCFVCHQSTPGHDAAPTMPAWHTAALDCRSCHGMSLAHPDNGDSCISCHR